MIEDTLHWAIEAMRVTLVLATANGADTSTSASSEDDSLWWTDWLTPNGVGELIKNGGLVLLAWLFFTGKIITSKQHDARVADLVKAHDDRALEQDEHHARELIQKDASYAAMAAQRDSQYAEMKESRDYYRGARLQEQSKVERLTDQLVESNEVAKAAAHVLKSLSEVAAEGASP